jgi:tetratricopeptide (TPR) repeat protein
MVEARSRRAWLLGILMVLLVGSGVTAEDDAPLAARIAEAQKMPAGEAAVALEGLLRSPEAASGAPRLAVLTALSKARMGAGQTFAALDSFEQAVALAGGAADVHAGYAEALVRMARENLARGGQTAAGVVTYLQDARVALGGIRPPPDLAKDPGTFARVLAVRADSLYLEGKSAEAEKLFAELDLGEVPTRWQSTLHGLLARIRYELGDMAGAAEAFRDAGEMRGAAAAWAAARRPEETVSAYLALIKAHPEDLSLLTEARQAVRFAGGGAELEQALGSLDVPETAARAVTRVRAELRTDTGDLDGALALWKESLIGDDTSADPLVRIGVLLLRKTDLPLDEAREGAVEAVLEALKREPDHDGAIQLGWHLASLDYQILWKTAAAGPALERSLRVQRALVAADPEDATALGNLGNTLRVGGLHAEALETYARAIAANPYDPGLRSDEGLARAGAGEPEKALEAYLASLEVDSSHLAGRQNAARSLWQLGRDDEAEQNLAAGLKTARNLGRDPGTWRFLLDRVWRCRQDARLR